MQTNRATETLATIDYGKVLAEANAERAKILRDMFRQARAYIAGLFKPQGVTATQN